MKKTIKLLVVAMFAVVVAVAMCACGSGGSSSATKESKTAKAFNGIDEQTGIHLNVEMEVSNQKVAMDIQSKNKKAYAKLKVQGQEVCVLDDDDSIYTLVPSLKTGTKSDDDTLGLADQLEGIVDISDTINGEKYTEGTKEIDGKTYDTEEYKDGDDGEEQIIFCFDGDKLCYIVSNADGKESSMKINALDSEVDDSVFKVPSNYTITNTDD